MNDSHELTTEARRRVPSLSDQQWQQWLEYVAAHNGVLTLPIGDGAPFAIYPDLATRLAGVAVLNAAFERCAGDFHGGGDPCARQMSGEAVANVRASLAAALAAFDAARLRCPSGPTGVVSDERAFRANVVPANEVSP